MGLLSDFPPFRRIGFDYSLAGHSARGSDTAHFVSAHASEAWGCLGDHRPMDNGGGSG